jgi:hypothetical protein
VDDLTQRIEQANRECDTAWEEYQQMAREAADARQRTDEARKEYRQKVLERDALTAQIPSAEEFKASLSANA